MTTTRTTTAPTTMIAFAAAVAVVMALLPAIVPPAWAQAPEGDPVERVGGSDRVGTAVAVSQRFFDRTDTAVLATASRYPDALAAGPLARAVRGPILLTPTDMLPQSVSDELHRLGVDTVLVVGGDAAVSDTVVEGMRADGLQVDRIAGPERFATAEAVARWMAERHSLGTVTLARGRGDTPDDGFADALTAATLGMLADRRPTVLTERDVLPDPTRAVLPDVSDAALLVGGTAAISTEVATAVQGLVDRVDRVQGLNRADTSVNLAEMVIDRVGPPRQVLIVTGSTFPDSLVAGGMTELLGAPVLLVPSNLVDGFQGGTPTPARFEPAAPEVTAFLQEYCEEIERATVLGLEAAVSPVVEEAVARLINCAPLGEEPEPTPTPTPTPSPSPSPTPTTGPSDPTPTPILPPIGGVIVPDVVGLQQGEAMGRITGTSLVPASGGSRHDAAPAGTVLAQTPPAGTEVARGTAVEIVVSLGPELGVIPDVVGLDEAGARQAITDAGFAVGRIDDGQSDSFDIGEVNRQLPRAGQRALPNTPVDVTLTTGTVNDPPTITSTPTTSHTVGSPWTYDTAATDPDGDTLVFVLQAGPLEPDGSPAATISPSTGLITWDPTDDDAGPTDFAVRVEDGRGGIDVQSFTLDVAVPNRAPVATDDVHAVEITDVLIVDTVSGVLSNDTDPDADPLVVTLDSPPANGTVALQPDGSFTYDPDEASGPNQVREDIELTFLTRPTVTASAQQTSNPAGRLVDRYPGSSWFVPSTSPTTGATITLTFPLPVTPEELTILGNRQSAENGFGVTDVQLELFDAGGTTLLGPLDVAFDPGTPGDGADPDVTVDLVAAAGGTAPTGVTTIVVTITGTEGRYPGLGEIIVTGDGPVTELAPEVQWADTSRQVWTPPSVGDLDRDGHPEVVYVNFDSQLRVVDGRDGTVRWTAEGHQDTSATPVLADIHDSPGIEVISMVGNTVRVLGATGDVLAEAATGLSVGENNLFVADVDTDGDPEVLIPGSNRIAAWAFDDTGTLVEEWRTQNRGCGINNSYRSCIPTAADIDLDGAVEIVAGTNIYDGRDGRLIQEITTPADGWSAIGQFDDDPQAEIVIVGSSNVHLFNHDLTPVWPAPYDVPGRGGPPTVADFDGDGAPEIGVAGSDLYTVIDTDGTLLWQADTVDGSSNATGSTVFDFDNDGRTEVVYRDERHLWVYDGPTGAVRVQEPMRSGTTVEHPVVADVDADGHAEIVSVSDIAAPLPDGTTRPPGIHVWHGAGDNWVRARTIWNQHTYHVTNIRPDGTVPMVEQPNWLTAGLNNFRENAFLPDESSRLDSFTYVASDGADSDTATVFVDVLPPENDPVFTCDPAPVAVVGFPYESRICATDPDPGDDLTYGVDDAGLQVVVPGSSNPFLAAQPDGTTASGGDIAPDHSPVRVEGLTLVPGEALRFGASGFSHHAGGVTGPGPDGESTVSRGEERGIAGYTMPLNALVGVFLGADVPADPTTPPAGLDFSTPESRNQLVIAPDVEQVFFIGNGRTGDGTPQDIIVPPGATRLYLGTSDGFGWYNNSGAFEVSVVGGTYDGPTVDPGTGLISWTPDSADEGTHVYVFEVIDSTGRRVFRFHTITVVLPVDVPDVVGTDVDDAETTLTGVDLRVGQVTRVHDRDSVPGEVLEQQPPGGSVAAPQDRIALTVSLGPAPGDEDDDGDGVTPNEGDCNDDDDTVYPGATETDGDGVDSDCDGYDGVPPTLQDLTISPDDPVIRIGEAFPLRGRAGYSDGTSRDVTAIGTWSSSTTTTATVDGTGVVRGRAAGSTTITFDHGGQQDTVTVTVRAPAPADQTPPTIAITQPAGGSTVSAVTDVIGTANDASFASYTLTLLDSGGTQVRELGSGTVAVVDGVLGTLDPAGLPDGVYTLQLVARDQAGNGVTGQLLIRIGAPPGGATLEGILLNPVNPQLLVGDTLAMTATAHYSDGSTVAVTDNGTWSTGDGATATVSTTGTLTGQAPGTTTVTVDFDGGSASRTVVVRPVAGAVDRTPPTAGITTPTAGTTVTDPVDVVGTASDAELLRWTLDLVNGTEVVSQLATSTVPVTDGVLTTLDPTMLVNGSHELRLTVVDVTGNTATARQPITIDGQLKVGAFSLSFTDLTVPMPGLPLEVTRQYDTRDDGLGDFGYGWRLGLSNLHVTSTGTQGLGWAITGRGFAFQLQPTRPHTITIVLPDGRTERFEATTTPSGTAFVPPTFVTMGYVPLPGTRGRLEPLGNRNVIVLGNIGQDAELADDTTLQTYDPAGFRYTTNGGVTYLIDADGDIRSVTDADGNRITITAGGITHSGGRSVVFERDALDRITAIVDPDGNRQVYAYDATGDLVAHTDPTGARTTYRYTGAHDLVEIVDPLGRTVDRREYDADGRMVTFTDALGNRIDLGHDIGARQEVITEPNGAVTVFDYDERGNVLRVTDPRGAVTSWTYDANDVATSHTDPLGRTSTYVVDADGNVLEETDPAGNTTVRTFTAAGDVLTETDPEGNTTTFTHDSRGNVLSVVAGDGELVESTSYDSRGTPVIVTDGVGGTVQRTLDAFGRATTEVRPDGGTYRQDFTDPSALLVEDPLGNLTTIEADAAGRTTAIVDPEGARTVLVRNAVGDVLELDRPGGADLAMAYDPAGRILSAVDATGVGRTHTYDAVGQLVREVDATGATTTYSHDQSGNVTSRTDPDGATTTWTYDLAGQMTSETDANGATTTFTHDAAGNLHTATDPAGGVTTYAHDGAGNLVRETDPAGVTIAYAYDARNRLVRTTHGDGGTVTRSYDNADRLTSVTDAMGNVRSLEYDAAGNLIRVTEPGARTTIATYDRNGNRTSVTDPLGRTTRYAHDHAGRIVRTTFPSGLVEETEYDAVGNPVRTVDRAGGLTTRTFDEGGRLLTETRPDGTETTRRYDAAGRTVHATDSGVATDITTDELGRPTAIQTTGVGRIAYTYDAVGNLTTMTAEPTAGTTHTVTYAHDAARRLVGTTDAAGTTTYAYDLAGRPTTVAAANGVTTTHTYDIAGRLDTVTLANAAGALSGWDATRDLNGDITMMTALDGATSTYTYDANRWLVDEQHRDAGGTLVSGHTYTYDAAGNRTLDVDRTGARTTSTYDPDNRLMSQGDLVHSHDARGNRIGSTGPAGSTLLGYDRADRLISARTPQGVVTYTYDAMGNRITEQDTSGTSINLHDPLAPTGLSEVVISTGPAGQVDRTFGLDLIAVTGPDGREWTHADHTGDMRLTTDSGGQVVAQRRYDAFGTVAESQGTTLVTHLFDGERLDARTGLYVMRARDYDPTAGLFTGVDPETGTLAEPLTRHAYQYALNNPITYEDRTGRVVTVGGVITGLVIGAVIGAIGGIVSAYQQGDGFTHEFIGDATVYGLAGAVGGLVAGILGGALVGILADVTAITAGIALVVALVLVIVIFAVNMLVLVIQGTSPRVAAEEALVSTLAAGVNIARNTVLLLWNIGIGIANYLIGKYEEPGDPPATASG